jgi:hypothetical protein
MRDIRIMKLHSALLLILATLIFTSPAFSAVTHIGYSDYHVLSDPSFDVENYFKEMRSYGVTLQRLWVIGYSNVTFRDERMPFVKTDGKYDLTKLDPEFMARLRKVLELAKRYDQKVMLTLFDRWTLSHEDNFKKTPWYYTNNHQRLLRNSLPDFHDIRNAKLMAIHENYVRSIVAATREFHPIYEIMNEARLRGDDSCKPVIRWHNHVARWIRAEDPAAEIAINVGQDCSNIYTANWIDIISLHYGQWENGICDAIDQLKRFNKQVIIDTDGAFKERHDNRLVKRWLQQSLQCGAWFNHKDEIDDLDREALEIFRNTRGSLAAQASN